MSGLIFVRTENLDRITSFYQEIVGMNIWLEQPGIDILQSDNLLVGFQQADEVDTGVLLTFFYHSTNEVDEMYGKLKKLDLTTSEPKENAKYKIYNFFAKDPDGRTIEFQKFLHPLPEF